jgi:hypothetical protein
VNTNNPAYSSVAGVLFNKDQSTLLQYPEGNIGAYTIPSSVTSIAAYAFSLSSTMTSVQFPNSVTNIGYYAFEYCTSLTNITIGNSVTTIGDHAFVSCTNLTSVTIPNRVTSIGSFAFGSCRALTNATIGNGVTSIGNNAFLDTKLMGVIFTGNAPSASGSVFDNGVTIYYLPGTTGWLPTFAGLPTAVLWNGRATASATLVNGFVVGAAVTASGYGYTNTPQVRLVGGGGSGAQAVAVVSNGVVTAVNVLSAGSGYTSVPLVLIEPPFIPNPPLSIAPMSFLTFSNVTVGGVYQLQQLVAWYWSNQPVKFTATNTLYTRMVAGVASSGDYRLALNPVPAQAFATPQMANGFIVGATVISNGSGYVTSPAVTIVGGGGSGAQAASHISGGAVTSISITSAGTGYTNTPTIRIAPPPAVALSPTVLPMMQLNSANLNPYDNYQIQIKSALGGTWASMDGGQFTPTGLTSSQYGFTTNGIGFFRLQYVP